MARALKVFRTPIGFHDAYVAAPSRKAALEAWGADKDLFQSGSAELVTDPKLTAAPLAAPGKIVKLSRGTVSEHLQAAGRGRPKARSNKTEPAKETAPDARAPKRPAPPPKPKPRPSRDKLTEAEAALAAAEAAAEAEVAEFAKREAQLRKEREAAEARQRRAIEKAEQRLEQARERYEAAMDRWRAED